MFTYSHKKGDDFIFCSNHSKFVTNPQNNHICFIDGKEYVYYQAKKKDGMLELHVQYSMLEPDFIALESWGFIMLKDSPDVLFEIID